MGDFMKTLVFAAKHKNKEVLKNSSSGGAFTALTDVFLEEGNALLCSHYNYETNLTEFHLVESFKDRDASRGSMYLQSDAKDSWKSGLHWLREHCDKKLMFVGVGCQAAGFLKFAEMNHVSDRVITVDIICHGSPSPMIWKEYIESVCGKKELSQVNFRDKRTGWAHSVGIAVIDGEDVSIKKYRTLYSGRYTLRKCCSECPYTVINRKTDMTIGDFWHIEKSMPDFADEEGISLVLIHSEKGKELFDSVMGSMEVRQSNTTDCWQMNLEKPTQHSEKRQQFWRDYNKHGIDYVMDKYGTVSTLTKVKRKLASVIRKV